MANEYRVSGIQTEIVVSYDSVAQFRGIQTETVVAYNSDARLSGIQLEVVRSIDAPSTQRREVMLGTF